MSADALAALRERLHQQAPWLDAPCVQDGESCGGRCGSQKVIDVLFPPDHPLRTGEPNETMIEADRSAPLCAECEEDDIYERSPENCPACAANRLRAALAVLRES